MAQPAPALRTPPRASALPLQIRYDFGKLGVGDSNLLTDNF